MDDPAQDVDKLLGNDFGAYGPARNAMAAWYKLAEGRYCDASLLPAGPDGNPYNGHQTVRIAWDALGNAPTMVRLGKLMDEAKTKARGQGAKLVDLWDKGVWSYMSVGRDTFVERMKAPIRAATRAAVPAIRCRPYGYDRRSVAR